MQYILLIHGNADAPASKAQWDEFFKLAKTSGVFVGGSEIGSGVLLGAQSATMVSDALVGYMRFESDNVENIYQLLRLHPVVLQGGSVELCETPKT